MIISACIVNPEIPSCVLSRPVGVSELISGVDTQRNTPRDSSFCCEPLFVRSCFILYIVSQHGQPSHSCEALIDVSDSKRSKLKRTCVVYLISFVSYWRIAIIEFASFCQVYLVCLDKPVCLFSPELHEATHVWNIFTWSLKKQIILDPGCQFHRIYTSQKYV